MTRLARREFPGSIPGFLRRLMPPAPADRQRRIALEARIAVRQGAAHEGAALRTQHLEVDAGRAELCPFDFGAVGGGDGWCLQTHPLVPETGPSTPEISGIRPRTVEIS